MSDPRQRAAPSGASREVAAAPAFDIKGSVFTLSVLNLYSADVQAIAQGLAARPAQAVEFFRNAPLVIDLQALPEPAALDFGALAEVLRAHYLIPVGVRNIPPPQQAAAVAAGLGLLPAARPAREPRPRSASQEPAPGPSPASTPVLASKTITQPVRSGQQIYAQGGDLTVLGAVSAGAELLADGHIHVYGPMRGRALAGIKGNVNARIFCRSLEAELVSVAGNYRVIENPGERAWGRPAQVYLADNRLLIEPL
jgi:septum site-determining protein MinC